MKFLPFVLIPALLLPCRRSEAPIPIFLGLALKCVAISTIGATIVIIYRCEPDYYLIKVSSDGEPNHWLVSQATTGTVAKNEGWKRCEGPWKKRDEPDFRAWVNNHEPSDPMFPCGPLGTIPGATHTNLSIMRVTLLQSADAGNTWTALGSTIVGVEDEWQFALLPTTGTNGLSRAQIEDVAGCSEQITMIHGLPPSAIYRANYEEP